MSRLSVRTRTALTAGFVTAIAVAIGVAALLLTLRSSLIAEIDRSLDGRASDIQAQWDSENPEVVIGLARDDQTVIAIFDGEGYSYDEFDTPFEPSAVLDAMSEFEEPFDVGVDLRDASSGGAMRAIVFPADVLDEVRNSSGAIESIGDDDIVILVATSTDGIRRTEQRISLGALFTGPLLVLLVAALTWFLTGRALRPVELIRQEVESIGGEQLDRRVPVPDTSDEISKLAGTMNEMLDRVETSHDAQQQFVSDASHELRSPLASIAARIDVARRHGSPDDWDDTLGALDTDTRRLRTMIDDLLRLARADSAPLTATKLHTRIDIEDLVLEAEASIATPANVRFTQRPPKQPTLTTGDAADLRRLIINLLSNAFRHGQSSVDLTWGIDQGTVVIHVDDDGEGIPADARASIFERFVRLDDARGRDDGGSGLGLAISREITRAHDGEITVTASPLGGARFSVTLPHR